ncbi:hypothetical protein OROMI_016174 [Orobanche minor]
MKNHELRPTGSTALPEVNATFKHGNGHGRGRGHKHGRGRGYGRGRGFGRGASEISNNKRHKASNDHNLSKREDKCHKCGMTGHWSRTCRTTKHLVDLYQKSIKGKGKIETNVLDYDGPLGTTHLDVSDFFADPKGDIGHLIGGGVLDDID